MTRSGQIAPEQSLARTPTPGARAVSESRVAGPGDYARLLGGEPAEAELGVGAAVSARIQRQEVLEDRRKRFIIVMAEAVLMNRLCSAAEFGSQLERIRASAALEHVTVRILPTEAQLQYPPLHGFQLFDDTSVSMDVINASLSTRGKADLRVYAAAFEHFHAAATPDIDPILDRYSRLYAGLALAALGDQPQE